MIKVNFLTREYKSKIFFRKFITLSALLILIYILVIMLINTVINSQITKLHKNRENIVKEIKTVQDNIVLKRKETESIEDLSNKTKILEDILNQRKHGFSDVLFQIQENLPENTWLTSLSYIDEVLVIKGMAGEDRKNKLSSEKNLLIFEKNMKEAEKYIEVIPNYYRAREDKGSVLQEFQYTIKVNNK
jgi:Tfp pilus assembly protein PilN